MVDCYTKRARHLMTGRMMMGAAGGGVSYMEATGGTITTYGNYKIHTFTSSGDFVVTGTGDIDAMLCGGGGSGGSHG